MSEERPIPGGSLHGRTDLRVEGPLPPADLTEDQAIAMEREMLAEDDSRGGVPAWLAATLNHCTRCGARLALGPVEGEERDRLACTDCGFIAYVNPRLVVTTLPITANGDVLLLRRGIEPARGLWAQPGGFLEIDETVREAAVRETLEEIGVIVEPGEIVGLYSRPEAAIVVVAFEATIVGGEPRTTREALEVRPFAPEAIPWPEIAFRTSEWALRDWLRRARPDLHPGPYGGPGG
jgi:ADP-ribose pyrophosphatase YjhB (NUDIX family)